MKRIMLLSCIVVPLLMAIGYTPLVQNRIAVTNSLEFNDPSPCVSPSPTLITTNDVQDEEKDSIDETTDFDSFAENNSNELVSLQEIVGDYFSIKNSAIITISQQTDTHAQGEFNQKWWLAFNDTNDGWKIIASGCSYINCDEISGFNFPSEMAPVCWDVNKNQLINR